MRTTFFSAEGFIENVDVLQSKFERLVFELFNFKNQRKLVRDQI